MKKPTKFIKIHKNIILSFLVVCILFVSPVVVFCIFILNFYLRIYPNVYIGEVNVGGLTEKQALNALSSKYLLPDSVQFSIKDNPGTSTISASEIEIRYPINESVLQAYKIGRSGNFINDLGDISLSLFRRQNIKIESLVNKDKLAEVIDRFNNQISNPPVNPKFVVEKDKVVVDRGQDGMGFTYEYGSFQIVKAFETNSSSFNLNPNLLHIELTEEQFNEATNRVSNLEAASITLKSDEFSKVLIKQTLFSLFNPKGEYQTEQIKLLVDNLTNEVNRDAQDPVFRFENNRVVEFAPSKDALKLNSKDTETKLLTSLKILEQTKESQILELPIERTASKSQVSDINNLGIKELIGRGTSKFSGSIPSRIHNVALAASRVNGVLVAPNETFSFARAIGDVSKYTGYKEAYIIQNGRTILGDGGGVCQVSTTLFRAVMSAGLPIVERHAHAYRVGYYEQDSAAGLDATVYVPSVDFKFKNDTQNYVLIQTKVDTKKLTAEFSIYGTSDGRVSTISKPVLTNQIAPPDDEYIDDPTLKAGVIQQVEHKAWGGTSTFTYSVKRNGEELFNKKFVSVYQPWKAVYMRGTAL